MTTLLIATRNAHKVCEIRAILGERFRYLTLNDFPAAPEIVEDADTFAGNAAKKAVELARWVSKVQRSTFNVEGSKLFVLADDSGLEVDALDGAPGVNSARFAALDSGKPGNSSDAENNVKLLRLLKNVPPEKRTARFRCVLALAPIENPKSEIRNPKPGSRGAELFEGVCEGRIALEPHGRGGFGYDPLFVPDGFSQSFAELGEDAKNRLSHRAKALAALKAWLLRGAVRLAKP
jgi:XTP/dITP diphosphohydrolase